MGQIAVYIYTLTNPETGEVFYVGKTINPELRKVAHGNTGKRKSAKERYVWELRKRGLKFVFTIIETIQCEEFSDEWGERERHWIDAFKGKGMPLQNVASGGAGGSKHSPETLAVISAKAKAWLNQPGRKEARSAKLKGKKLSDERREAIRKGHTGMKYSDAHRKAISEGQRGRKHPHEALLRIAQASKGRRHTPEMKAHLSEVMMGRKDSDETRAKKRLARARRRKGIQLTFAL